MLNPYVCVRFILAPTHYDQLNALGIKLQGEPLFYIPSRSGHTFQPGMKLHPFSGICGIKGEKIILTITLE